MIEAGTHVTKKDLDEAQKRMNRAGDELKKLHRQVELAKEIFYRESEEYASIQGALKYGNGIIR